MKRRAKYVSNYDTINISLIIRQRFSCGVDSQTKCKICTNTESCMEYEEWEPTTVT